MDLNMSIGERIEKGAELLEKAEEERLVEVARKYQRIFGDKKVTDADSNGNIGEKLEKGATLLEKQGKIQ